MRAIFIIAALFTAGAAQAQTADPNGDGKMTAAELAPGFKARLIGADTNKDGRLTLAEAKAAFREGATILYGYDKNNDGALSGAEIETAATLEAELGVGQCDKNGDGALSGAETACYTKSK